MKRESLNYLKEWYQKDNSKPLIIRGARQVGKSTLVRLFCEDHNLDLIEFNFEIETLTSIEKEDFKIQFLLDEIQLKKKKKIKKNTLIFFDEIQESPRLLKLLRYFYEDAPQVKVIAAGSLLEIALKADNFSFPVGRVQFYHLGPMSFREFLWATNQFFLDEKLSNFEFSDEIHKAGLVALRDYFYVGGMPEAVKEFSSTDSLANMRELQNQIVQTYQADFPKYNKRINIQRINRTFSNISLNVGEKVIYSKLDVDSTSRDIKRIVELLIDSRVILPCIHTSGNTSPLTGESDPRIFKTYFLDIGLLCSILNLNLDTIDYEFKNEFNMRGVLAEQYVAQHLNYYEGSTKGPSLFYHLRDKGAQKAEIDFLIEDGNKIYPIEVKASASGHLKSLKYFCGAKKSRVGIKLSLAEYSEIENFVEGTKLVNIPLYAVEYLKENIHKLEASF